ncbi:MAG: hypothetical protein M1828_001748 [Chrysothrix sp. TS-e1954]|nr:MAG: hypothetical protein M1828_001748 [Chrysothrix sp. TS-e1954]
MSVDLDSSNLSDFDFSNPLPTPYDTSLPPSRQEPANASWTTPLAAPPLSSVHSEQPRGERQEHVNCYSTRAPSDGVIAPEESAIPLNAVSQAAGNGNGNNNGKYQGVHDCEADALTVLRSLHHRPLYCPDKERHSKLSDQDSSVTSDPGLVDINAGLQLLPSLDKVLHANKSALSGVVKLLDCSCAQRPYLATLYMSIISKIMSLYEIASVADMPSSEHSTSNSRSSQHPNSTRLTQSTVIRVGVFHLDEDDQASLQRNILLRELRKMERAVEKFASLCSNEAYNHDTSVRQWHSVAVTMLRTELRRIYKNCEESVPMAI